MFFVGKRLVQGKRWTSNKSSHSCQKVLFYRIWQHASDYTLDNIHKKKHGLLYATAGRAINHLQLAKNCYFTYFGKLVSDLAGGNIHNKSMACSMDTMACTCSQIPAILQKIANRSLPTGKKSGKTPFSVVNCSFLPVVPFPFVP